MTTDNSQIRVGILGTGRIGSLHAELLHNRVDGAKVSGVFDVSAESAQSVATSLGVQVFNSAEDLIASDSVDAVAICTSTDTHVDLIVAAAQAGKPIFCEKPVSLDLEQVDRALAAVAEAGVSFHVGFNRRFDLGHSQVRKAVQSGDLGDLRQVRITSRDPAPPPVSYIKVSGGIFLDMTIHDFDMARYLVESEVVEVFAKGSVTVDPAIGEAGDYDTVVVVLTHANGVVTTIDNCRQAAYGYDQRVEAFGSLGMCSSENQLDHNAVLRTEAGSRGAPVAYFFLDRYVPSYLAQWEDFLKNMAAGTETSVTGSDGRAPLVIGLAAAQSVSEGIPISIA